MADTYTPNFSLLEPELAQSGWGPKLNSTIGAIDTVLLELYVMAQLVAISNAITVPPASPADRDIYIVAVGGAGAWFGHDNDIAVWSAGTGSLGAWQYITPKNGWSAYVLSIPGLVRFNGTAWV